jgi:hypothetical protein
VRIEVNTTQFKEAAALVSQWRERAKAVRQQFLYRAVTGVYDDVLGYLPSDRKELRDSLRMQRIRGLPDNVDGYVIRSVAKRRAVAREDVDNTVIYVAVKDNLMRPPPKETLLLQKYSPWTMETLPYAPDPKTADVMSRKVSKREVIKVRRMRTQQRVTWRREMIQAGIRLPPVGVRPIMNDPEPVPDTAFESMRLEFGLGGEPAKPHWRKAILWLAVRGGTGMIARKREFTRAMTDLEYRAWERWPKRGTGFIPVAQAKRYVPFQKRLGLRVRGR